MEQQQGFDVGGDGSVATKGVEQAKKLGATARRRVFSYADSTKESLLGQAEGWIDKLATAAEGTRFADGAIGKVRGFAGTVKTRSTEELVEDVQLQARERPAAFLLGAFALGFLGARLLRDVGSDA